MTSFNTTIEDIKAFEVGDGCEMPVFKFSASEYSLSDLTIAGIAALNDHIADCLVQFRKLDIKSELDLGPFSWGDEFGISVKDEELDKYGILVRRIQCIFGIRVPNSKYKPVFNRHGLTIHYCI